MTDLPHSKPSSLALGEKEDESAGRFTRRTVLAGAAVATAAISVGAVDGSASAQAIIDKVQATPDTKYLARSIVLMWYLGAWYDPDNLRALVERPDPPPAKFEVISPKAYTQGWALRVAQAHPMGFSEMQFGYWSRPPSARVDFIGN